MSKSSYKPRTVIQPKPRGDNRASSLNRYVLPPDELERVRRLPPDRDSSGKQLSHRGRRFERK